MHHTEDTTAEQMVIDTPEIEELSGETLSRAPGRGRLFTLLHVFSLGKI